MKAPSQDYLVSPSQFSTHKECSQKHRYVYGLSLRSKKREKHFEVGSYWHELAHHYFRILQAGYTVKDIEFKAQIDAKLRKDLEDCKPDYQAVLLQVHIMFRRYLTMQTENIDINMEILDVEREFLYPVIEGVSVQGIIDLVYRNKVTGQLVVRDHKTGANKSTHTQESLEYNDQLMVYACLVYSIYGEVPAIEISWVNSKVDYAKSPTYDQLFNKPRRTLTKEQVEGYWTYIQEYVYHMQSTTPIRAMTAYKCKNCPFKEPCLSGLRGMDETPLLEALFKKVPRDYDFIRFTELSGKHSEGSSQTEKSSVTLPGGITLTFDD